MDPTPTPPSYDIVATGACFYLRPSKLAQRAASFVDFLGGAKDTRHVLMNSPAALAPAERQVAQRWIKSGGRYLDISAYSAAAFQPDDAELFVIFNDTLFIKHPWRLIARRMSGQLANLAATSAPSAVGIVDPSTHLLILDGSNPTRRHMSTFCFVLNRAGLALFNSVLTELPLSDATERTEQDWLEAQMGRHSALRHVLHVHLTGPANPHSWSALKSANADLLLRKAVTVVFEYLLTQALLEAGGMIVPINIGWRYRQRSRLSLLASRFGVG